MNISAAGGSARLGGAFSEAWDCGVKKCFLILEGGRPLPPEYGDGGPSPSMELREMDLVFEGR
jgi:hypothetical protein